MKEVKEINRSDLKVIKHMKYIHAISEPSDLCICTEIICDLLTAVSTTEKLYHYYNLASKGTLPWELQDVRYGSLEKDELAHRANLVFARVGLRLTPFYYDRDFCEVRVIRDISTRKKFLLWSRDDIYSRNVYVTPYIKDNSNEDYLNGVKEFTSLFFDSQFSDKELLEYLKFSCLD